MLNAIAMKAASIAQKVLGGGVAVFEAELSNGMTGFGQMSFIGKLDVEKITLAARAQAESVLDDDLEIESFEFVRVE